MFVVATSTNCSVDIIFVLDASGSVGRQNFDLMKSYVSGLVGKLDVQSGRTRVGLVVYSSRIRTSFHLNTHIMSLVSILYAISGLIYTGGGTNTAGALFYVRTVMLTMDKGDRSDVPNVVVVFTDGSSNNRRATLVSDKLYLSISQTRSLAKPSVACPFLCCQHQLVNIQLSDQATPGPTRDVHTIFHGYMIHHFDVMLSALLQTTKTNFPTPILTSESHGCL